METASATNENIDVENAPPESWLSPRADTGVAWCMRFLVLFAVLVILAELGLLIYLGVLNVGVLFSAGTGPITNQPYTWAGYRLPPNITLGPGALQYAIAIQTSSDLSNFSGYETIQMTTLGALNGLVLHSSNLAINSAVLTYGSSSGATTSSMTAKSIVYDTTNEYVFLTFPAQVPSGLVALSLNWTGIISNDTVGFYRANYTNIANGAFTSMLATQFEPNYARRMFPCFDDPSYKAKFILNVTVPTSFTNQVLSNTGPAAPLMSVDGLWTTFQFPITPTPMAPYLLAIIAAPSSALQSISQTVNINKPITISVWAQPSQLPMGQFALNSAIQFLTSMTSYTQLPYWSNKLDLVAVPDFENNGMENWGLITFRETALLVDDPTNPSMTSMMRVAQVVAHEIVHQWFGNFITPAWWNDLWIAEGSANFYTFALLDAAFPQWQYTTNTFLFSQTHRALSEDELPTTPPLIHNVTTIGGAREAFDITTYSKGAAILAQMASQMTNGISDMNAAISNFLMNIPVGSGVSLNSSQFVPQMTQYQSIAASTYNFTSLQSNPVAIFYHNTNTSLLTLTQMGLESYEQNMSSDPVNSWTMDVKVMQSGGLSTSVSLTPTQKTVPVPSYDVTGVNWYKANPNGAQYYRVAYPISNWQNLLTAIQNGDPYISSLDKASLISDSFVWAEENIIPYAIPLGLINASMVLTEGNYNVWAIALDEIGSLANLLQLQPCFGLYKLFISNILTPAYNYYTWNPTTFNISGELVNVTQTANATLIRSAILSSGSTYIQDPTFVQYAVTTVSAYATNLTISLSGDTADALLKVAVRNGGSFVLWDQLWARYLASTNAAERSQLLIALATTTLPYKLRQLLSYTINPAIIKPQDTVLVIRSIAASGYYSVDELWDFFQNNIGTLVSSYPEYIIFWIQALEGFSDSSKRADIATFFTVTRPDLGAKWPNTVADALQDISDNIAWIQGNSGSICTYLTATFPGL